MMNTNEVLEFINKLKELGVTHFENKDFKVSLNDKHYQTVQTVQFQEQLDRKVTLEDELFNQGL